MEEARSSGSRLQQCRVQHLFLESWLLTILARGNPRKTEDEVSFTTFLGWVCVAGTEPCFLSRNVTDDKHGTSMPEFALSRHQPTLQMKHVHGNAPLVARHTVSIVMRALSAKGSIMVPTTVLRFHRRAIQPSSRSVIPAYVNNPTAHI